MNILQGNKRFVETQFEYEEDFEELVRSQSKILFGEDTIFIYTKRKLKGLVLGNTIPDGFLFDLTDLENPEFYLVEVELQEHDFHRHMLSQVTKFIGFFHSLASQNGLMENLFSLINADTALMKEFKKYLGNKEISKFLNDICKNSRNILLVIDGEKDELQEIIGTSKDWGKFVKILVVKAFTNENETLVTTEPDFIDIRNTPALDDVLEMDHLTTPQRAMRAVDISTRQGSNISMSEATRKMKVTRESAYVAKRIKDASPILANQVRDGKLSLNAAEKRIAKVSAA